MPAGRAMLSRQCKLWSPFAAVGNVLDRRPMTYLTCWHLQPPRRQLRQPCEHSRAPPDAVQQIASRCWTARDEREELSLPLFNHAEVIETVRTEFRGEPYWQRALEYAHAGGLQAVLDEYTHLLRESLGAAALPVAAIAEKIGNELIAALTIRTASLGIEEVTAPRYAREIKLSTERMRIRFAMRFGDDRADEDTPASPDGATAGTRKE